MAPATGQNSGRRVGWQGIRAAGFLLLILMLFGGWALAWRYGAGALHKSASLALAGANGGGQRVDCENLTVKGFPFRVGIFCDRVGLAGTSWIGRGDWRIDAGALRSAAQLYDPGHIVSELDGPVEFEGNGLPSLRGEWKSARASLRLGIDGPKRLSLSFGAVSITAFDVRPIAEAESAELHLRPSEEGNGSNLDLALSANRALLSFPHPVPAFNARIDCRLDGIWAQIGTEVKTVLDLRKRVRRQGLKGEARSVRLEPESGGGIALSGPFEIGPDGLITAKFTVEASDPAALMRFLSAALPPGSPAQQHLGEIENLLSLAGAAGAPTLLVAIDKGAVSAGIFSLGRIPSLF